jgi:hypothetical protein
MQNDSTWVVCAQGGAAGAAAGVMGDADRAEGAMAAHDGGRQGDVHAGAVQEVRAGLQPAGLQGRRAAAVRGGLPGHRRG